MNTLPQYKHTITVQNLATSAPIQAWGVEDAILIAGFCLFGLFVGILGAAFLMPLDEPLTELMPAIEVVVVSGFTLPPVWTATPVPEVVPTPTPTQVFTGTLSPELYTPRTARLAKHLAQPNYAAFRQRQSSPASSANIGKLTNVEVLDLARIMEGESGGDAEAAYQVAWVAKNRLNNGGYGNTYLQVSSGFFGYRASINPRPEFLDLSRQVISDRKDPTGGCLYALSRTDITNLGVPARRADVNFHEWFFFKTWPLAK